ncbi:MAG: peptide deformylase [Deltaproteobacteria bacterium]|nr:MAG: peptide deformylase [Pseudomonadota bacterium]PIE65771.1 MAG: peptide deformylase [Deltaproteobacteria bacterium]
MAIVDIVKYPDPVLREISQKIGDNREGLEALVRDMTDTMYAYNGAGLAAIQIGVPKSVFIVEAEAAGRAPTDPPLVFIDPTITWLSEEKQQGDEGCLSFPGVFVPIERSMRCRTKATTLAGEAFEAEGEGLFARAMQHEYDHLNGRLLADFVGRIKRRLIERKLARSAH